MQNWWIFRLHEAEASVLLMMSDMLSSCNDSGDEEKLLSAHC